MKYMLYPALGVAAVLLAAIFVLGTGSLNPGLDTGVPNPVSGQAAMRGGPQAEAASVTCEPGLFVVWENNVRRDSYDPAADACAGYRCLTNGNEVSPACYSVQECVLLCKGECMTPAGMPAGRVCVPEDSSSAS